MFSSIVDAVSGSNWSYLIVFAVAMIDAFFPIVPSEATAIAAGVIAGTGGLNVWLVILAASLGAIAGDNICFALGHFLGYRVERRFFAGEKSQKRLKWAQEMLEQARRVSDRRRALHSRRPHRDDVHLWSCRDLSVAPLSHVRRARGRDLGQLLVLLGYFGGKTFEEEPWKALLLAFGLALAVTGVIEGVRHLRALGARSTPERR